MKLTSKSPFLIDSQNGQAYVVTTGKEPARYTLTGPAKFQIDFRTNVPKRQGTKKEVFLTLLSEAKELAKLQINTAVGGSTWKKSGMAFVPSEAAEFFIVLGPGTLDVEFHVDDSLRYGGGVLVESTAEAAHPIAADSPVLSLAATPSAPSGTTAAQPVTGLPVAPPPAPIADVSPKTTAPVSAEPPSAPVTPAVAPAAPSAAPAAPVSAPEVKAQTEPVEAAPQAHALVLGVAAGVASQAESNAFAARGAVDVAANAQANLPLALQLRAGWEGRFGPIAVATAAGALVSEEIRHAGHVKFGWNPTVATLAGGQLKIAALLGYRLAFYSNEIASALVGWGGLDAELSYVRGTWSVFAGGGYALRLHDSTPASVTNGAYSGRAQWTAGVRAALAGPLGAEAAYRGDLQPRVVGARQSHAVTVGLMVELF